MWVPCLHGVPMLRGRVIGGLLLCAVSARAAGAGGEPSTADKEAGAAYARARANLRRLKTSPESDKRRRAEWLQLASKFSEIEDHFGASLKAPDALFTAATIYDQTWRRFKLAADKKAAIAAYTRLCDNYGSHRLADDARFALGKLFLAVGDKNAARRELIRAVALDGDMAGRAQKLLRSLPGAKASAPRPETPRLIEELSASHPTEATLSEQMGLKVRRIVLDAGHGGKDSGAIGPGGLQEKDAALDLVLALAALLEDQGYEVGLTRDEDRSVPLGRRAEIANEQRADLFISIHLNSAPQRSLGGAEVYTLDVASDRYAVRLAARENAAGDGRVSELGLILADLATKANTADSAKVANSVDREVALAYGGGDKVHGVKHALFRVLVGARCPAILVEAGFISNPEEEKKLRSAEFRDRLARAIADGVARFMGVRDELAQAGVD